MKELNLIRLILSLHDYHTHLHTKRVQGYSKQLGKLLGLTSLELDVLDLASQFHDVGKIGVEKHLLTTSKIFDNDQIDEMKMHTYYSELIINHIDLDYSKKASIIARHHHERIDGNGYPDKLKGDDIPILSRLITVADMFDAIHSKRNYHTSKKSKFETLEIMERTVNTKLDEDLFNKFKTVIERST